ncbi:hypothetical protein GCM10009619_24700 [Williamsia maris]
MVTVPLVGAVTVYHCGNQNGLVNCALPVTTPVNGSTICGPCTVGYGENTDWNRRNTAATKSPSGFGGATGATGVVDALPALRPKIDRTTAANAVNGVTTACDAGATIGADDDTADTEASDTADEPPPVVVTAGAEPITGNVDDGINGVDDGPDVMPGVPDDVDAGVVGAVVGALDPEPPDEEPADPDAVGVEAGGVEAGGVDAAGAVAPVEPEPDVDPEPVEVGVDPSDDFSSGAGVVVEVPPIPVLLDVLGAPELSLVVEVEPLPAVPVWVPDAALVDEPVAESAADVDAGDTVRVVDDESSDELAPPEDAPPPVAVSAFARPDPLISTAPKPTVNALVFTQVGTS